MKKLFWIFTIRKKIKKLLVITVREQAFFENKRVEYLNSGKVNAKDYNYLNSRIEIKKEVADILRSLL